MSDGISALDGLTLGQRVAELRWRRGLSQKDLAVEVGRSESWVSQVERDVLPVERVSVLQTLADALGASVRSENFDRTLTWSVTALRRRRYPTSWPSCGSP